MIRPEEPTGAPEESTEAPSNDEPVDALLAAAVMDTGEAGSLTASDGTEAEDILTTAQRIDDFFLSAVREQASAYGPDGAEIFLEAMQVADQFTAVAFVNAYRAGGIYPEDRLRELVLRFTDVRLQEWYIRFDAGSMNEHYYLPIHQNPDLANSMRLTLSLMAVTQSIIGRSRIAWEKLMRAIYYLETGGDLQPSGSRSYKGKFFNWVSKQPTWLFLEPYKDVVTAHDDRFRTGEFHKGSVLRRVVIGGEMPDLNEIMNLSNYLINTIWPNIVDIVRGEWPHQFTDLHSVPGAGHGIDSRYLPPNTSQTERNSAPASEPPSQAD
jgi:hypothetical protein